MRIVPRRKRLSPSYVLRRQAFFRGVLGRQRVWLAIGGVLWGTRLLKRLLGRNPEYLGTEVLAPGQFVSIRAIPPSEHAKKTKR
jgi:hypothetical protein